MPGCCGGCCCCWPPPAPPLPPPRPVQYHTIRTARYIDRLSVRIQTHTTNTQGLTPPTLLRRVGSPRVAAPAPSPAPAIIAIPTARTTAAHTTGPGPSKEVVEEAVHIDIEAEARGGTLKAYCALLCRGLRACP